MLAAVAAALMVVVLTQRHKAVLPMLVVQVVRVAEHMVFVEVMAVEVKARRVTAQQVGSLSALAQL
jgi:hypothetical protein